MTTENHDRSDETRLWIGNLDSRLSEYQLIKALQKFGKVTKFDFLFHKSGPLQGQPRGYCFVTFEKRGEATRALQALDGHLMLTKKMSVKWAHLKVKDEDETKSIKKIIPGLSGLPKQESEISLSTKIRAIEAKLKLMEENKDESDMIIYPQSTCSKAPAVHHRKHMFIHHHNNNNNTRPYQKHRTLHRFQK